MGTDLTAPQLDQCADLIAAAEAEVDRETGRSWLTTTPVSGELHTVVGGRVVYLDHRPVLAVTTVTVRSLSVGSDLVELEEGIDYELIDAENGILLFAGPGYPVDIVINTEHSGYDGYLLEASYTHSLNVIDPAIQKITTELVAYWMQRRISASSGVDLSGIKSFDVPDLLSVTYRDDASTSSSTDVVPPDIVRRLRAFEKVLFS